MRRGEIWWVEFGERRPVVLLSAEEPSGFLAMQVVAPADTDISGLGMPVPSSVAGAGGATQPFGTILFFS